MSVNKKYVDNLKNYGLWLPLSGIILLPLLSLYYFVYQKEVITYWRILSIIFPFICFSLLSLPLYLIFKKNPPYFSGKFKYITILILFLTVGILFSQKNNFDIQVYKPNSLGELLSTEKTQYLIFTSDNCDYCVQMKSNYRKVANQYKDSQIYYIDLTDSSFKKDPQILEQLDLLNVEGLPTLIQVKRGKVERNLIGKRSLKDLEVFFNNDGKGKE